MQVFSKRVIHIRLYNILGRYKWSAQFYYFEYPAALLRG